MTKSPHAIHSLLIPLQGTSLLLPCATAAEIIDFLSPTPLPQTPPWLLGSIEWRKMTIPLIAFEAAAGHPPPSPDPHAKIIVLNALGGHPKLPFFAILAKGTPRLVKASRDNVAAEDGEPPPLASASVRIDGEPALIPDLDALENRLLAIWAKQGPPTGSE